MKKHVSGRRVTSELWVPEHLARLLGEAVSRVSTAVLHHHRDEDNPEHATFSVQFTLLDDRKHQVRRVVGDSLRDVLERVLGAVRVRVCPLCLVGKDAAMFPHDESRKNSSGRYSYCLECNRRRVALYRQELRVRRGLARRRRAGAFKTLECLADDARRLSESLGGPPA